ncbi:MAG: hypothetical protein ACLUZQ_04575 [Butyricicoccus sp.]
MQVMVLNQYEGKCADNAAAALATSPLPWVDGKPAKLVRAEVGNGNTGS